MRTGIGTGIEIAPPDPATIDRIHEAFRAHLRAHLGQERTIDVITVLCFLLAELITRWTDGGHLPRSAVLAITDSLLGNVRNKVAIGCAEREGARPGGEVR